ncbi:MAG TPA: carboxymuconolactone decarboxylase family protein, partial [Steroidobacter sp.]|nr:carboxymuconolactone decarboxylase family protein [Steroidobacter sp.]
MSQQRSFNIMKHQDVFKAMLGLNAAFEHSTLEPSLIELVKLRASQLNGCGFCVDMHSKDARLAGEAEQRLYLLTVWREAPGLYTDRERAALAWAEAVTRLENQHVPDAIYDQARAQFSDEELVRLTLVVV